MEPETSQALESAINLVAIMKAAKEPNIPDGLVYEDHLVRVEKTNGVVTLTGQPIKFPFIYGEGV